MHCRGGQVIVFLLLLVAFGSAATAQSLSLKPEQFTEMDRRQLASRKVVLSVPADYHVRNFGFFCRQELKMQRVNIPLVFRLGSVSQCNMLEQKPGYR